MSNLRLLTQCSYVQLHRDHNEESQGAYLKLHLGVAICAVLHMGHTQTRMVFVQFHIWEQHPPRV